MLSILSNATHPKVKESLDLISKQLPLSLHFESDMALFSEHLKALKPDVCLLDGTDTLEAFYRAITKIIKLKTDQPDVCVYAPSSYTLPPLLMPKIHGVFFDTSPAEQLHTYLNGIQHQKSILSAYLYSLNVGNTAETSLQEERKNHTQKLQQLSMVMEETKKLYLAITHISGSINISTMFNLIMESVLSLLECHSVIIVMSTDDKSLTVKAAKPDEHLEGMSIQKNSISNHILTTGKPYYCRYTRYVSKEQLTEPFLRATTSFVSVPLVVHSHTLGVIHALHKKGMIPFEKNDIKMLKEFAAHITQSIQNAQLFSEVEVLALQDGLTKLYNRNYFQDRLRKAVKQSKAKKKPLSILMMDIDLFKSINDSWGHQIGDAVLRKVATVIKENVRTSDVVARYGGEEMVSILTNATPTNAFNVAEKIRKGLEAVEFYAIQLNEKDKEPKHMLVEKVDDKTLSSLLFPGLPEKKSKKKGESWSEVDILEIVLADLNKGQKDPSHEPEFEIQRISITISIGIATYPDDFLHSKSSPLLDTNEEDILVYMSDKSLYKAKKNGRNRSLTYQMVQQIPSPKILYKTQVKQIKKLMVSLEKKDADTYFHSFRVAQIATIIAQHLGLTSTDLTNITLGGILHDIGKTAIDSKILLKPSKLNPQEYDLMKSHVIEGVKIVEDYPELHPNINAIRSHHERWNGKGYPDGLAESRIPVEARIIAVADVYDAMVQSRPYHTPSEDAETLALDELKNYQSVLYDADIVKAFIACYEAIKAVKYLPEKDLLSILDK